MTVEDGIMSTAKRMLQNITSQRWPSNEQGQYLLPGQRRLTLLADTVAQKYVGLGRFRWVGEIIDPDPEPEPVPPLVVDRDPEPEPEPVPDPDPADTEPAPEN